MSERAAVADPRDGGRTADPKDDEISPLYVAAILLRGRRTIVALSLAIGFVVGLATLLWPKKYTATVEFVPQAGASQLSSLASLAGQFGINVPAGQESQGPDFYQELLSSRSILTPVVEARYQVDTLATPGDSASLLDLKNITGDTPAERLERGIEWFEDNALRTSVDDQTAIVTLNVTTHWPEMSYEMASALLDQMQAFDLQTRQTQARAEREFLEGRVEATRQDLHSAEDSLQAFLEKNRQYSNSPELTFQFDRLNRQVTMRQQLYTTLSQSYEQARIQEVQNTPVITVIERPIVPPIHDRRRTVLKTLAGLIFGGMLGIGVVAGRGAMGGKENPETVALKDAWADTKQDLQRFVPRGRRA